MDQQHGSTRQAYKYRLKPTPAQQRTLETVVWRCRDLYNAGLLQERKAAWERRRVSITFATQSAHLPAIKEVRPEYRDLNAQVLHDVLHRLDKAFHAVFRRVQAGEQPGYRRLQGRDRYDRYDRFTSAQVGEHGGAVLDGSILSLSKIGRIPMRLHRPLQGPPKTITSSRQADGWSAGSSCAEVRTEPLALRGQQTGIDVGLKVFLITADGEMVGNPGHSRKAERRLAKAQRRVARRTTGSQRRRTAVALLQRKHQPVQRQRCDFQHKTALALLRTYDTMYLEDLQVRTLSRRPQAKSDGNGGYLHTGAAHKAGLNKSMQDAGWYIFPTILTDKAACAGKRVEAVPPAYTTQDCSGCGERVYKSLSVRTHVCTHCGLMLDRDLNAAQTMLRAGQAPQARTWPGGASVA